MSLTPKRHPEPQEVPPQKTRGRDAERMWFAEALADMRVAAQSMTQFAERFAGRAVNHVLLVETATFDASGQISRNFHTPAGAVEVMALGANNITVHAAGAGSSAPGAGVGVSVVKAGTTRTVGLASHVFTLYGTPGDQVSFQVWSTGASPVA